MNIEFQNAALEELYTLGKTQDHQYKRLPKSIIKLCKGDKLFEGCKATRGFVSHQVATLREEERRPKWRGCSLD